MVLDDKRKMRVNERDVNTAQYQCSICGVLFNTNEDIQRHIGKDHFYTGSRWFDMMKVIEK